LIPIKISLFIVIIIACVLVALAVGFAVGVIYRKKVAESTIGSAQQEATRIVNDAVTKAEQKKKEAILEAKDDIHKQRTELERELRDRRAEVQRQERRIIQKEESLDKKTENIEKKDETLSNKLKEAEAKTEEIETVKRSQIEMLERISGFTKDQAKDYLLKNLEEDLVHEKAVKVMEYEQKTKDEADDIAKEIIATAIQRCAADHSADATVSVVPLPNDEMKGRIIGREGRNIRTLETITGVDLIIDDTPEAITVSCFDPVRREVARLTLEKLIADGRIHPTRIEELFEKIKARG
jgi:ribonuclease Y